MTDDLLHKALEFANYRQTFSKKKKKKKKKKKSKY